MTEVKRFDLGGDILLSGEGCEQVDTVLQDLLKRGAQIISPLTLVGSRWVAACTQPKELNESDSTSTLDLRQLQAERRRQAQAALCGVEQLGFKIIVTGPTHEAVYARVVELLRGGAVLVSDAEESGGNWFAVCDGAVPAKSE